MQQSPGEAAAETKGRRCMVCPALGQESEGSGGEEPRVGYTGRSQGAD